MRNYFVLLFTTLLFSNSTAFAEFKVATVDINRVINEANEAKGKRVELEKATKTAKQFLQGKNDALEKKRDDLKNQKIEANSAEAKAFRDEAQEFSKLVQDKEKEIQDKYIKLNRELTQRAVSLIDDYAKENNFDLVLDRTAEGRGPVLYGASEFDLTDEIIKGMNGK